MIPEQFIVEPASELEHHLRVQSEKRWNFGAISGLALFAAISFIAGPYPEIQWFHHVTTPPVLILLVAAVQRDWLPRSSLWCLLAFYAVHIIGARYIYSYVPYDDWLTSLCGISPSEHFGWTRNHYDRFVHLAYGALITLPMFHVHRAKTGLGVRMSLYCTFLFVLGSSSVYELFEWGLAVTMAPDFAEGYNGQQGDPWDAHKDMLLAAAGSLIVLPAIATKQRRARKEHNRPEEK